VIFPPLLYSEKQQPIDFSHKLHVDEVGECEGCHYFREDGSFSGIPALENCLECHEEQMGEHPEEAKLVKEYVEPGKEIPWLIYARQPQCVFFSHAAHVKLTKYSRDIWGWNIAGYKKHTWDRMKMDDCAECHEARGSHDACFVCHK